MSNYDQRNQKVDTQLNADKIHVGLKPVTCPKCKYGNLANAKFCSECGTSLLTKCPICEEKNSIEAKFCSGCGAEIASADSKIKFAETMRGGSSRELSYTYSGQVYRPLSPIDHLMAMADRTTMRFTLDIDEYIIKTEENVMLYKDKTISPDWKGKLYLSNKRLIMLAYKTQNKMANRVLLYPFSDLRNVKFGLNKILLISVRMLSFLFEGNFLRFQGVSNTFNEEWEKIIKQNS